MDLLASGAQPRVTDIGNGIVGDISCWRYRWLIRNYVRLPGVLPIHNEVLTCARTESYVNFSGRVMRQHVFHAEEQHKEKHTCEMHRVMNDTGALRNHSWEFNELFSWETVSSA